LRPSALLIKFTLLIKKKERELSFFKFSLGAHGAKKLVAEGEIYGFK
jgi:hypothetical protein